MAPKTIRMMVDLLLPRESLQGISITFTSFKEGFIKEKLKVLEPEQPAPYYFFFFFEYYYFFLFFLIYFSFFVESHNRT